MAAGVKILHKRKAGAFIGGDLAEAEIGLDTTNDVLYVGTSLGNAVEAIDPAAAGTVTSSNTPLDGEIAVFTSGTDIEGTANLTFDGTDLAVNTNKVLDAGDTTAVGQGWFIDEDNMASDDATKVPSQQSVKAYVDSSVVGLLEYKGAYNGSTNSPDLDGITTDGSIQKGDTYTVTVAGTFYTTAVEIGDVLIAETDNNTTALVEGDWTIVQRNEDGVALTANDLTQFAATTSAGLAGVISDETGSGALVFGTSPTIATPALTLELGTTPTAEGAIQWDSTNDAIKIGDGTTTQTFSSDANISITESQISDLGTSAALVSDNLSVFAATTSAQLAGVISDETGSGALVFGTSPTIATPALTLEQGTTPTAEGAIQWDATNDAIKIGDGTGTKTFSDDASLSITESQISDLGTTVAMVADNLSVFAATTSAQLAGVISDETGSGALVFGTGPTITSLTLNDAASTIDGGTI